MKRRHRISGALALAASLGTPPGYADAAPNPDDTTKALRALLSIANEPIPETSTCAGAYGQEGPARIKDLLAVQLAYLYNGTNTITGNCTATTCTLTIKHSAGEDVTSAIITFDQVNGVKGVQCFVTP